MRSKTATCFAIQFTLKSNGCLVLYSILSSYLRTLPETHLVAYGPQVVPVLPCPWKRTRLAPGVVPVTLDLYQKNPAAASSETASYDDPATETVIAASCLWNRSVPSSSVAETAAGAAALCWQTDENGETYCPDSHVGCCCCADFGSTIRATAVDFSSAEEAARATRNVSSCVNHSAIFSGSAMRTNRSVKPTDSNRKNLIGSMETDRVHVAVLHVLVGDWRSVSGLEMAIGGVLSCLFYRGKLTRIVSSPRRHYRRCCHSDISYAIQNKRFVINIIHRALQPTGTNYGLFEKQESNFI